MNLRKTLGIISASYKEPAVCESCGEDFVCGASLTGCWCLKTKLTDQIRRELKSKYKDCLCQNCLGKYADGKDPSDRRG